MPVFSGPLQKHVLKDCEIGFLQPENGRSNIDFSTLRLRLSREKTPCFIMDPKIKDSIFGGGYWVNLYSLIRYGICHHHPHTSQSRSEVLRSSCRGRVCVVVAC